MGFVCRLKGWMPAQYHPTDRIDGLGAHSHPLHSRGRTAEEWKTLEIRSSTGVTNRSQFGW